jgi:hypothetical protein
MAGLFDMLSRSSDNDLNSDDKPHKLRFFHYISSIGYENTVIAYGNLIKRYSQTTLSEDGFSS